RPLRDAGDAVRAGLPAGVHAAGPGAGEPVRRHVRAVPADAVVRVRAAAGGRNGAAEAGARQRLAGGVDPAAAGRGGDGRQTRGHGEQLAAAGRAGEAGAGVRRRLLAAGRDAPAAAGGAGNRNGGRIMNVYVGTSGYSYREWIGPFYPKGLPTG